MLRECLNTECLSCVVTGVNDDEARITGGDGGVVWSLSDDQRVEAE